MRKWIARSVLIAFAVAFIYAVPVAGFCAGKAGWWVFTIPPGLAAVLALLFWAMYEIER